MYFAQFYQKSAIGPEIIEACGDRSVIILDGRMSRANMGLIAKEECLRRGYLAWSIFRGEAFTRSTRISQIWYVTRGLVDNTAMAASYGA